MIEKLSSGAPGLNKIIQGGITAGSLTLIQGSPGTGKTTLALQFLRDGSEKGQTGLYVSLSQTEAELRKIAASHGWSLDGIHIVDISRDHGLPSKAQSIFHTSDLHLDRTRERIDGLIDAVKPARLVYDSLLEVRLLTADQQGYQRELIGLRQHLQDQGITALLLDAAPAGDPHYDTEARGIVDAIITLEKTLPEFGRARRRIEVAKMRGVAIRDGWHDMDIRTGSGVTVFPRTVPSEDVDLKQNFERGGLVQSGLERLDGILGGGMEPGTTTMVVGQTGVGKSTIASLYAQSALRRGEKVALFLFEERVETFFRRSEGLGMNLRQDYADGRLKLYDFNPDELSAGEFGQMVQREAESDELRVVVIDSFTGYVSALSNQKQALFDIQSLLKYLARRNILTILIVAEQGLLGENRALPLDLSFLGDTVLLLMIDDHHGRIRRRIVAVKKRHGPHDLNVRELIIQPGIVDVGEEVTDISTDSRR
ncbi:ATPase domain-containing protein [Frigidibacter sp. MR17.24]|uniref:ATPase domain-containing protein n=1 Tax=Frigidibacter sp. MR17.24 TaxID=3127345 RepID=UPI0030131BC6